VEGNSSAVEFRGMNISRFRDRVKKTAKLKCAIVMHFELNRKIKMQKQFVFSFRKNKTNWNDDFGF